MCNHHSGQETMDTYPGSLQESLSIHKPFLFPKINHYSDFYKKHQRGTLYFGLRLRDKKQSIELIGFHFS